MDQALLSARRLLENVTPLNMDCGLTCAHACCSSTAGDETGMLLFPGEEDFYADLPGYTLKTAALGTLLICEGRCLRCERPLSCRMFPLLPVLREDGVKVAVDLRAKPVCPLAQQGRSAMSAAFIDAVREAGRLLAQDDVQRAFLMQLTNEQDELRALRQRFGGHRHV